MTLDPKSSKSLHDDLASRYFSGQQTISVYMTDDDHTKLQDYALMYPSDSIPHTLHLGMVTTRWIGSNTDYTIGKQGGNAVQGVPWLRMHNETSTPLYINENIKISPGGTLRYTGRDHFGVRLGTVFTSLLFGEFVFSVPATDIYFGVTSDVEQPIFGGFQFSIDLQHTPDRSYYMLEPGYMGGPPV